MVYDPQTVLNSIDNNLFLVNGLMAICMVAVVIYYTDALKLAKRHQTFPIPFAAAGWYAVHDLYFASEWQKWFVDYSHWWLEMWAVACFFYGILELVMCYQVYKYGRKELMPGLTQKQFGIVLIMSLVAITIFWIMLKQVLDDDLCLIAFAVTTFWPQVWATLLMIKRQSMRGISTTMLWCMVASPVGMFSSWYFLDPFFRSPIWLSFAAVTVSWAVYNVWLSTKFPRYVAEPESIAFAPSKKPIVI